MLCLAGFLQTPWLSWQLPFLPLCPQQRLCFLECALNHWLFVCSGTQVYPTHCPPFGFSWPSPWSYVLALLTCMAMFHMSALQPSLTYIRGDTPWVSSSCFLICHWYIWGLCVFVCMYEERRSCHSIWVESRQLSGVRFFPPPLHGFQDLNSGHQACVGKCLYQLSHLTSTSWHFYITFVAFFTTTKYFRTHP